MPPSLGTRRSSSREPLLRHSEPSEDIAETPIPDAGYQQPTQNVRVGNAKVAELRKNLNKYNQLFGAHEEDLEQPTTTQKELWSYYLYYNVSIRVFTTCRKRL